uniref:Uncharacterized protein n=1 Tax=Avena sativa TaxID=4498 RepID=A0ACD5WMA1_AVESA
MSMHTPGIIFDCRFARVFWRTVHCAFPANADVQQLFSFCNCTSAPAPTASTYLLLCCWNLWKHRNAVAFRAQQPSLRSLLQACRNDAHLWRARLSWDRQSAADAWLSNRGLGPG